MIRKASAALLIGIALAVTSTGLRGQVPGDGPPAPPKGDFAKKGGPPGGPGGGFGPGMFIAPALIEAADLDKDGKLSPDEAAEFASKLVREAAGDKPGPIDAPTLGRAINKRVGPPGGGDGPPSGDFGPGTFLAPGIVEAADTDKDGKLSPDEARAAASKFVRDAAGDKPGPLDSDTLAGSINRRMGPPGGFGPGGPGGPMGEERKVLAKSDKDGDGRLNLEERKAARAAIKAEAATKPARKGGPFGFGGPGPGMFGPEEPVKPGPKVAKADSKAYPGKPLYDPDVLRTLFLDFEEDDWEVALGDFHGTDVEVPATLTVDGKTYPGVGVHFRGMSSYMMVRAGHKRSLNLDLDFVDAKQRVDGYKTLNLLNAHEDPTFLHTVLYFHLARQFGVPAPRANFVKLVINGESWGLYTNAQQFDKVLTAQQFPGKQGARWKVRGNPGADGGLRYVGDDLAEYKRRFEMKAGDDGDWKALIGLCRTLDQTPPEGLEAALKPILDVEGVLRFLALDVALINSDGYWTRASDYSLYRDGKGVFHVIPHDANETFQPPMGPGMGGGRPGQPGKKAEGPRVGSGSGVDLDPLVGLNDARKPLRSKLLAVPALRDRYLAHVRSIARDGLDWAKLGPVVAKYRDLIGPEIEADTRKLSSTDAFRRATADAPAAAEPGPGRGRSPGGMPLRAFAEGRRDYLLDRTGGRGANP